MRKIIILFLSGLFIVACNSENAEDLADPSNCDIRDVGYQDDIKALLSTNCGTAGCHGGPNGIGGLDLNTFDDAKQIAANGQLLGRVTGNSGNIMPPSGQLPQCEIDKITAWVQDGAPNN